MGVAFDDVDTVELQLASLVPSPSSRNSERPPSSCSTSDYSPPSPSACGSSSAAFSGTVNGGELLDSSTDGDNAYHLADGTGADTDSGSSRSVNREDGGCSGGGGGYIGGSEHGQCTSGDAGGKEACSGGGGGSGGCVSGKGGGETSVTKAKGSTKSRKEKTNGGGRSSRARGLAREGGARVGEGSKMTAPTQMVEVS